MWFYGNSLLLKLHKGAYKDGRCCWELLRTWFSHQERPLESHFFPLSDRTFPSLRRGRSPMLANARRPCEWNFFFFFEPKSRDLSWRSGVQKLARTQTHTPPESQLRPGGSALQTVLCCFATRRLHWSRWEMSVGGKREHYSLIRFFSSLPVCPHFPSQPVMLYESLTHLAATN